MFVIFINDICDTIRDCSVKLFADDVKLYLDISCNNYSLILPEAITSFHYWANEWQLEISYNKCQVLHLGAQHQHANYHLGNFVLSTTSCAKDLGLIVEFKLNFKSLYTDVYVRASQRSALILHSFTSRDSKLLTKAFCTYVRPILEYGSSIWSPVYQSDIHKLEYMQKHLTKRLDGISNFNYTERLKRLGIDTLEKRRLYCDLNLCYKMLHGHSTLVFTDYFIIHNSNT